MEEIGGTAPATTPGSGYDQTVVDGTVNLNSGNTSDGATLRVQFVNSFMPTAGQTYTIINNDSNDAVLGTFAGLAEGSAMTAGGVALVISSTTVATVTTSR